MNLRNSHLLPQIKWYVFVLDHVLHLPLHGDEEKHEEVEQEDRPEYWDVKNREKRGYHAK